MLRQEKLKFDETLTNDEIRQVAKEKGWNGAYITQICRCGEYWSKLDGCVDTAKVLSSCSRCYNFT